MADIFISYASEDEDRIRHLVKAFEKQGWSVFWDHRIPAGQTWRSYIGKGLAEARCVVVAWTKESIASNWVSEEADEGKKRGVLVPVRLDEILPPIGFRSIQAADLSDWRPSEPSETLNQLIGDIRTHLGGRPIQATREQTKEPMVERQIPSKERSRNPLLYALLALLLVVAIGVGFWMSQRNSPNPDRSEEAVPAAREVLPEDEKPDVSREAEEAVPAVTGVRYYHGDWINTDSDTRGITRIAIRVSNSGIYVQAWGKCHPKDCDWGQVKAEAFSDNISSSTATATRLLSATFTTSFSVKRLVIRAESNERILLENTTRFTDQSGRENYSATYTFRRR
ncbi:MAG TPA: toll/interleukin-1 receptor domain-containing protein [Eudoraea sp.]|nr:toll/interleukin-1 receptor domain-containing protein [Eudoraea sp.]